MCFVDEEPLAFFGGLTGLFGRVDFLYSFLDEVIRDVPVDLFTQIDWSHAAITRILSAWGRASASSIAEMALLSVPCILSWGRYVSTGSPSFSGLRAKCRPCNRMTLGGTPPLAIQLTNTLARSNAGCLGSVALDFTTTLLGLAAYCSGGRFFLMEGVCQFGLAVAMRIVPSCLAWLQWESIAGFSVEVAPAIRTVR